MVICRYGVLVVGSKAGKNGMTRRIQHMGIISTNKLITINVKLTMINKATRRSIKLVGWVYGWNTCTT